MVNYDCGVASIFNQWHMQVHDEDVNVQYVNVLKDIYLLDYDPMSSPIVLMQCEWVQNGIEIRGNLTYQWDEAGFLRANFHYIMVDREEPFIFPSQTQEVFLWMMTKIHNGKSWCIKKFNQFATQWIRLLSQITLMMMPHG